MRKPRPELNFIPEPNKQIKIAGECDVVVVGGGPGGIGAAVSAARNGADVVLIERYGHLGDMGTGGLVTIIPCLSDFSGTMQIGGINQEWIERLEKKESVTYPTLSRYRMSQSCYRDKKSLNFKLDHP